MKSGPARKNYTAVTIRVIDGRPHAYVLGRGFVPVRGASPAAARDLELAIAAAQLTGQTTLNVPGLEVVPDIPEVEAMKVFICWAGEPSHKVALILRDWLPSVLQHVEPWVSSEDIEKGAQWPTNLKKELEATTFGIICVVPGNLAEPWLNFEAGVIFRGIDATRVAPFLVGVDRNDVSGPLGLFQSTILEKEDVRKLVQTINRASERPIPAERVNKTFDSCWPDLARRIEELQIRQTTAGKASAAAKASSALAAVGVEPSEKEVAILVLLAKNPDADPTDGMIARAVGEQLTRTQYHLDRLKSWRLIDHKLIVGEPPMYYLTARGRAYVVEKNLI